MLRDTVEALWAIAEASGEPWGASLRVQLMDRGKRILGRIIRRGVATGAFRPVCPRWAERDLAHALVAGACARWVFGLPEGRSLRARPAADAALAVLRPPGMSDTRNGIPYRRLGRTGEMVSLIGVGGYHLGRQADEQETDRKSVV